jgi:hypothetical protein
MPALNEVARVPFAAAGGIIPAVQRTEHLQPARRFGGYRRLLIAGEMGSFCVSKQE